MRTPRSFLALAAIALVLAIGGFVAYDQFLRGDEAVALSLPSPAASADPAGSASAPTAVDGDVSGTWTVAAGSQAGYRVREQLAGFDAETDAVGRTDQVSGTITLETSGSVASLTAGALTIKTTTITSDKSQRDTRMRTQGLETDTFSTAKFSLTELTEIPTAALAGTPSDLELVGDLELHGVTKSVTITAQAQLVDGTISVAGSIDFPLADYSIVAPNVGGFIISIADSGSLEFLVNFSKS